MRVKYVDSHCRQVSDSKLSAGLESFLAVAYPFESKKYIRSFLKNVTIAVLYIFVMSICQIKQNNFIIGPQNVKHILT